MIEPDGSMELGGAPGINPATHDISSDEALRYFAQALGLGGGDFAAGAARLAYSFLGEGYGRDIVRDRIAAAAIVNADQTSGKPDLSEAIAFAEGVVSEQTDLVEREALQSARMKRAREGAAQESQADLARELGVEPTGWPTRQTLPDPLPDVPTMPAVLLPEPLRDWVQDAAERMEVPMELIGVPAMVAAASLVGRSIGLLPKRADDWLVVPNLWGLVVGRPSTLKSPAEKQGTQFVRRFAKEAMDRFNNESVAADLEREIIELQIGALKRERFKGKEKADLAAVKEELGKLEEAKRRAVATERRYITQDATTEKLGELLNANPRGLLLLRDELAGWLHTLEKPGREGDREFYLEAWNGTGGFTYDRIGRGTVHIRALTLSIFGTIQPAKLRRYIAEATGEGRGDDGLLQRFQLAVWPDVVGEWHNVDRWPHSAAREKALTVFKALDELDPIAVGTQTLDSEIPALRFDPAAQELFNAWRLDLEKRLRSPELSRLPAYESHLAKYRSLMPALALVAHLIDVVAGRAPAGPVSIAAAQLAGAWVDFLDAHARRIYAIELNPGRSAARALAEKIEHGSVHDGDAVRDLHRAQWAGLSTSDTVDAGIVELDRLGWVQIEELQTGGRATRVLRLHPTLRGTSWISKRAG